MMKKITNPKLTSPPKASLMLSPTRKKNFFAER